MKICFNCEQHDDTLHEYSNALLICDDCERLIDGDERKTGTCPNCKEIGPVEVGCPRCPGFWYSDSPESALDEEFAEV